MSEMGKTAVLIGTGPNFHRLANAMSDAIHDALERGMETDEACCVAVAVIADYARIEYGDGYLAQLATVLLAQQGKPAPKDISKP